MNVSLEDSTTMASGRSGDATDPNDDIDDIENKLAAVMTFIIMIVGIVGNLLTVVALLKCPKVRNVTAAFIISLCIADLMFCAIVLPFSALRFLEGSWNYGAVLCRFIPFVQYGNIGVSLLCIGMITINRYVMIAHHNSYTRIYKRQWIAAMIAFCWLFSYGMQLPTLFGVWGKFDYDPKLGTCSIMSDSHGHSSKTTLFIIAFVIPCLIIIACYTKIFWVVHQSEMRMQRHAQKQNSIPNNLRPPPSAASSGDHNAAHRVSTANLPSDSSYSSEVKQLEAATAAGQQPQQAKPSRVKDQREMRAKRNEWRITKMVLAIFLSFVICYLPITVAKVADKDVDHPLFHICAYLLLYLSACLNPIIYVIMNKQYRKAYKTVLMCETAKLLSFSPKGHGQAGGQGANGAGQRGSSAAEKWKDTAFSHNPSRTLVSQVSTTTDQPNTSSSSSPTPPAQARPVSIELRAATPPTIIGPARSPAPPPPPIRQESVESQPAQTPLPRPLLAIAKRDSSLLSASPALVDVILEEEEEAAPEPMTPPPPSQTVANNVSDLVYANVRQARKSPSYGQNINVTPGNGEPGVADKVQPKHKI